MPRSRLPLISERIADHFSKCASKLVRSSELGCCLYNA
jgi:hypothetical protein